MKSFFKSVSIALVIMLMVFANIALDGVYKPAYKLASGFSPRNTLNEADVNTLNTLWTASVGQTPSVASTGQLFPEVPPSPSYYNGKIYIGSLNGSLMVYDAAGINGCSGLSPTSCSPIFTTAPISSTSLQGSYIQGAPLIVGSEVIVAVGDQLFAYDANGVTNCSGTPTVCSPLWSTASNNYGFMSEPIVYGSFIFAHDSNYLYAFSSNGSAGCTGAPVVCSPIWTASINNTSVAIPTVVGSLVLTLSNDELVAYDANGVTNCSGTPLVCLPLWTGAYGLDQYGVTAFNNYAITVGNGVYVYNTQTCANSASLCNPIWADTNPSDTQLFSSVSVSGNFLYVDGESHLYAFPANPTSTCQVNATTSVQTCLPVWSAPIANASSIYVPNSTPVVADDMVIVGESSSKIEFFDAAGITDCSNSVCSPLYFKWTSGVVQSTPLISGTSVYVYSNDGTLFDFGNPTQYIDLSGSPISSLTTSPISLNAAFNPTEKNYALFDCQTGPNQIDISLASAGTLDYNGSGSTSLNFSISLYPNQAVAIVATNPNLITSQIQYWIRCLPPNFPKMTVSRPGNPSPGYYLTTINTTNPTQGAPENGNYSIITNNYGTPIWYQPYLGYTTHNLQLLPGDNLTQFVNNGLTTSYSTVFDQLDTQTQYFQQLPNGFSSKHELYLSPNGNYYTLEDYLVPANLTSLGYPNIHYYIGCLIEELSPTNNILWEWNASDHVSLAEWNPAVGPVISTGTNSYLDPFHCNSLDVNSSGQVLLSMRNTSAMYLIDKATGKILWKLSGNSVVGDGEPHLTILNDPEGQTYGQHDARFEPNGDISCFDDHSISSGYARGVSYHINLTNLTATMDWEYSKPLSGSSIAIGSFRRLDGGNDNIIDWGLEPNTGFTEVDAAGNVLLSVVFPNDNSSTRAEKIPISSINLNLLRQTAGQPPSIGPGQMPSSSDPVSAVQGNYFHSVQPLRMVDTRPNSGYTGQGSPLSAGSTLSLNLNGKYGIPSDATAVALNITMTNTTQWSYLTVYPSNDSKPTNSDLNWMPNETVANFVKVPISSTGVVNFTNAFGNADLVVDLEGYYGPSMPGTGVFEPLAPTRICDTRTGTGIVVNPCNGKTLNSGSTLQVQVTGEGGIPTTGVAAVALNLTVTNTTSNGGYITAFPDGSQMPQASVLNWTSGQTVANHIVVPVGPNGKVDFYNYIGSADIVVDVEGWYTDGSNYLSWGSEFKLSNPIRIADTRTGSSEPYSGQTLSPGSSLSFQVSNVDGIPNGITGVDINLTATNLNGSGYLTCYPTGSAVPNSSCLNFSPNQNTVSNFVSSQLLSDGQITIVNNSNTSVDIVIDVEGYYVWN